IAKKETDTVGAGHNRAYYAINIPHIETAQKIVMPADYVLQEVCLLRDVPFAIKKLKGNFCDNDAQITLGDSQQVFCLKYNENCFNADTDPAFRFVSFLSHEAMHYYMQQNWKIDAPYVGDLTAADIQLLGLKYAILDAMRLETDKEQADKATLAALVHEYVGLGESRKQAQPVYFEAEQLQETAESAANYAALQAVKDTGGSFGVLAFAGNPGRVTFMNVFEQMAQGNYSASRFIGNWELYNTGLQLELVLDALGVSDWQQKLNAQTKDAPVVIYDLLAVYDQSFAMDGQVTPDMLREKYAIEDLASRSKAIVTYLHDEQG
ncbi:MAG: hypothetical protein RRY35_04075, partial [Clostridiales bacterium]